VHNVLTMKVFQGHEDLKHITKAHKLNIGHPTLFCKLSNKDDAVTATICMYSNPTFDFIQFYKF